MRLKLLFILLFSFYTSSIVFAQDALFGVDSNRKTKYGFILNVNLGGDIPGGDMAKRFGNNFRIGPSITYKTKNNFLFGIKGDFITGTLIKEDSLMINIRDKYSKSTFNGKLVEVINNSGQRIGVPVYERGYMLGVQFGKIFKLKNEYPDNGITILTSAGFIQHKITIYTNNVDVSSLYGNYIKGYDRLTNGWFIEQFVGYSYFAKNKLINFNIGLDFVYASTQGRRDYLIDVMHADNQQRNDMLIGIRGGWMIPIFRHKSEDLIFDN